MGRRPIVTGRTPRRAGTDNVVRASVGQQLDRGVDRAATTRWEAARQRAGELQGPRDEQVAVVTARIRRELGLAGAASGGTAAVPGVGLVTAHRSVRRRARLVDGAPDRSDHDDRRHPRPRPGELRGAPDVGALDPRLPRWCCGRPGQARWRVRRCARAPQRTPPVGAVGSRRSTPRSRRSSVRRYGTRAGVAAVGRAVPFGVGAAIGYGDQQPHRRRGQRPHPRRSSPSSRSRSTPSTSNRCEAVRVRSVRCSAAHFSRQRRTHQYSS